MSESETETVTWESLSGESLATFVQRALDRAHRETTAARAEVAALRSRIEALVEKWRYKGEFGWGPWQAGDGPDPEGYALDAAAAELLAALASVAPSGEAESGRFGCPECGGSGVVQEAHDGGTHPVHCRCTYGEATCACGQPWCMAVHERINGEDDDAPAPVPSGRQADGEGDGRDPVAAVRAYLDETFGFYGDEEPDDELDRADGSEGADLRLSDLKALVALAARPVLSREALADAMRERMCDCPAGGMSEAEHANHGCRGIDAAAALRDVLAGGEQRG